METSCFALELTLTASGEAQLRTEKDSTRRRRSRPNCAHQ